MSSPLKRSDISRVWSYPKSNWWSNQLKVKKLDTPFGYIAFLIMAIGCSYLYTLLGEGNGLLIGMGGITGIIVVLTCLANPRVGFYFIILFTFFVYFLQRVLDRLLPLGGMTEVLIISTFLGVTLKMILKREKSWPHAANPISYGFALILLFVAIEVFNPNSATLNGWFFSFRKLLELALLYMTSLYIFDSLKSIKFFIKFWLLLAFIAALYGCYEQWFGLPGFEYKWIISDPAGFRILLQGGNLRKFSFLADPPTFGALMSVSAVFCLILSMGTLPLKKKSMLVIMAVFMLLGMSFSGTRTATAMIPAGVLIYGLITIRHKKTVLFLGFFSLGLATLILAPIHSNSTINRLRSTFNASRDPSLNVRDANRKFIQPYMHSHPIGAGPATVGAEGQKYNPGNPLSSFPPDSAFIRDALEYGWIGFGLILIFYFIIMKVSIFNYYSSRNPEIRIFYAGIITVIFSCLVADYSQNIIGQITISTIFYPLLGAIVRLKDFDNKQEVPVLNKINR